MDGGAFVPEFHATDVQAPEFRAHRLAPPVRVRPRALVGSRFLDRDLSEQALRQPAPATYDAAALAAARHAGMEDGRAAGLAAAAASHEAAALAALALIAETMRTSQRDAATVADQAAEALARALVAALRAVMPDLVARSALHEVSAMLAAILPGLSRQADVLVEVPPALVEGIATALARLAPDQHEQIKVKPVDHLAPGEARVRWLSGQARRQPALVWDSVMAMLEPALPDTKTQSAPRVTKPKRAPRAGGPTNNAGARETNHGE